ncbi:TRAP transporter small permease [Pusillimonas minor]|uniref:TRAP transporter small permease protein n=1 Tax=Pusillimonas minor TaxID=2697024 RepID=A0A842HMS4_9BURK|nr:TRAP transporter small permease [Pusillimonas minor]MBC2769022.1 TRAP transporter small permease [Pusillimonas minor]
MLDQIDHYWEKFLNGLALVACLLIMIMVAVICADVGTRAMKWGNIPWSPEVAEYTLYLSTFLAAPWLLREGKHVRMDMLLRAIPSKAAWVTELIADIIGAATALILTVSSIRAVTSSADSGSLVLKILVFPEWWVLAPAAAMFLVLAIEFLFRIRRLWAGAKTLRAEATSVA